MNQNDQSTRKAERTTFPVYNQKLAGFLMLNGFVLVDIAPNEKFEGRNVFFFWDSPKIKETINSYFGNKRA